MQLRLLRYATATLLLSFASTAAVHAQAAKHPLSFEDVMKMKRLSDTDISPDGKWLLYEETDVSLENNTRTPHLWLVPLAGGEAHTIHPTLAGESRGRFSPDGKSILFQSSRQGNQQIYIAGFDPQTGKPGDLRQLTSLSTEADGALWSPDSKSILFTSSVYPDCPAGPTQQECNRNLIHAAEDSRVKAQVFTHLLYRHWNAFTGDRRSHLFWVPADGSVPPRDLTPGDTHDVPPFSMGGPDAYAFSPDSKEIAFTENLDPVPATSTNGDIFTLSLTDTAAKPVQISTSKGGDWSPAYSPDGRYLAFRSQQRAGYESDRFRLMLYDRSSRQTTELVPSLDRWVDEYAWSHDSQSLYFSGESAGDAPIFRVALGQPYTAVRLTAEGEYGSLHPTPDGTHLVATRMLVNHPGEAVLLDLTAQPRQITPAATPSAAATPSSRTRRRHVKEVALSNTTGAAPAVTPLPQSQITHLNDELVAKLDMSPLEPFWFTGAGHTRVQGFVLKPPAFNAAKKYPVKFLIHGGPQGSWGNSWSYRWNPELFAASGYVVVMINPRGSTGYGQTFIDQINGDWGGKPFTDLMNGLDYAEQHFSYIDKTRECALGASYGGFMANWLLGHTDRFRCIVSHDGMFNPVSAYGTTEELWFNEWEFKGKPWDYSGRPASVDPYRKWSPALSSARFKTPTLVIHGQLDYRLDVSEGYQLFTTLQRRGIPSKMLYFPDEGHWVLKPQNSRLWNQTVDAWVDQYLKPGGGN